MELLSPQLGLIFWVITAMFLVTFWYVALRSIIKNEFEGGYGKLIWVIVVIFVPLIGSVMYFAIGRSRKIKK